MGWDNFRMGWDNFRLGLMLTQAGKLNIACDNKERGLDQMEEGIDMLARLYGDDNKHVKRASGDLKELRGDSTTEEEDSRTSEAMGGGIMQGIQFRTVRESY